MTVINLFGAPGAGKSTGAAYLFSQLKLAGINTELVTEYAKDKVWEEDKAVFENQIYIFGKQSFRISRLNGKVSVVVTDSPILLSDFYNHNERWGEDFSALAKKVFADYDNLNFLVNRSKPYNPSGRFQTETESDSVGHNLQRYLDEQGVPYTNISGDIRGYLQAFNLILEHLSEKGEFHV